MSDASSLAPGPAGSEGERPGMIDAVPVRHPGRWVANAFLVVVVAMIVDLLVTNKAFEWSFVRQAMVQTPVLHGLLVGTLLCTLLAMMFGVALGVLLAVMRLSDNPIMRSAAWVYIWFFRAIPRLVLLTVMGTLGILWPHGLGLGIPFVHQIAHALGGGADATFKTVNANKFFGGLLGGAIGLGLTEAAYMAEIARAGILSVDTGQREAANALGMNNAVAMRRIVLPQAMRVIVPPTGNETIAMLKDTSLLIGLPLITEMFYQLEAIGARTYKLFPVLVAAVIWYLIVCSVLMAVQSRLERRFGRGFGSKLSADQGIRARMLGLAGTNR